MGSIIPSSRVTLVKWNCLVCELMHFLLQSTNSLEQDDSFKVLFVIWYLIGRPTCEAEFVN